MKYKLRFLEHSPSLFQDQTSGSYRFTLHLKWPRPSKKTLPRGRGSWNLQFGKIVYYTYFIWSEKKLYIFTIWSIWLLLSTRIPAPGVMKFTIFSLSPYPSDATTLVNIGRVLIEMFTDDDERQSTAKGHVPEWLRWPKTLRSNKAMFFIRGELIN